MAESHRPPALSTASLSSAPSDPSSMDGGIVPAVSFAEVSRAVVSAAADLVNGVQRAVIGTANVRTARDNAWDAMLADQARNQARADLTREVAQIVRRSRKTLTSH
jgi:hypothetical protein